MSAMAEGEYRELFDALRRRPEWARKMLDFARTQDDHVPYPQAVALVRKQGLPHRVLAEDFGVGTYRARQIVAQGEVAMRRDRRLRPADGQRLTEDELRALDISDLGLAGRVTSILQGKRIATVGDLLEQTEYDLLRIYSFGAVSIRQVRRCLAAHGLFLRRGPVRFLPERLRCLVDPPRDAMSNGDHDDGPVPRDGDSEPEQDS